MGVISLALSHARDDQSAPGHRYFAEDPMAESRTVEERIRIAADPHSIDYVTVLRLREADLWYRDPVDEMVFGARWISTYPDGLVDLVYYRGNTPVVVHGVLVKDKGIGCCWNMDPQ